MKQSLARIAPTWMNTSIAMKKDPEADKSFGWVLEMYAYAGASAFHGVGNILHKEIQVFLYFSCCPINNGHFCIWSLWSGGNSIRHCDEAWKLENAARHVSTMVEDLFSLNKHHRAVQGMAEETRWKPPDFICVKVNVDGAFKSVCIMGASGDLISNNYGQFIAAETRWYYHLPNAFVAEALVAQDGLMLL